LAQVFPLMPRTYSGNDISTVTRARAAARKTPSAMAQPLGVSLLTVLFLTCVSEVEASRYASPAVLLQSGFERVPNSLVEHTKIQNFIRYLKDLDRRHAKDRQLKLQQFQESVVGDPAPAKVLYVVYSDSSFYNTRLRWLRETWGATLASDELMIIGDGEADPELGLRVHSTRCPPHSHWEGACCKYAEAIIEARDAFERDSRLQWVYFSDDDAYVRTDAMAEALAIAELEASASAPVDRAGLVFGNWGCQTETCQSPSLCAGGGYAADRRAVMTLVGDSAADFLTDQMRNCRKCERWADIALTGIMQERHLVMRSLAGLFGWRLTKVDLDKSMADERDEPLMYHYIRTDNQMRLLHAVFAPQANGTRSSAEEPQDEEARRARCLTFRHTRRCSLSSKMQDCPWKDASAQENA